MEKAIASVPGVESVSVNLATQTGQAEFSRKSQSDDILKAIKKAGYEATESLPESKNFTIKNE